MPTKALTHPSRPVFVPRPRVARWQRQALGCAGASTRSAPWPPRGRAAARGARLPGHSLQAHRPYCGRRCLQVSAAPGGCWGPRHPLSVVCSAHRDRPTLTSGPAERPEDGGQLDLQGDGKQAPGPETAVQPEPSPSGPLRESAPRGSAQGCPWPPAPTSPPEGPSVLTPESLAPTLPLETQESSQDLGADEPVPIRASSVGLRPQPPRTPTAPPSPHHPAEPPRSKTTQEAGQEPEAPPSAPQGPSPATGNPDSPGDAPGRQPESPQPADRKLGLSGVDAPPLPEGAACPSLQEATRLIQEEFAFDGYLDRGLEALIMGTRGHRTQEQGRARGHWGGHHGSPPPRRGPARAEQSPSAAAGGGSQTRPPLPWLCAQPRKPLGPGGPGKSLTTS